MARVWFNLHKRIWSVKEGTVPVRHCEAVALVGVRFVVNEKARQRVIAKRCREVHAYAAGQEATGEAPVEAVGITYNPYRAPTFTRRDDASPVLSADAVYFLTNGLAVAVNPRGHA